MKIPRREIAAASSIYRKFRERSPRRGRVVRMVLPKAVAVIGFVEFIGYSTSHKGRAKLYKHDFAPGSRPYLCVEPARGQLFLIGGRYRFTDRGIVDRGPRGQEIDD